VKVFVPALSRIVLNNFRVHLRLPHALAHRSVSSSDLQLMYFKLSDFSFSRSNRRRELRLRRSRDLSVRSPMHLAFNIGEARYQLSTRPVLSMLRGIAAANGRVQRTAQRSFRPGSTPSLRARTPGESVPLQRVVSFTKQPQVYTDAARLILCAPREACPISATAHASPPTLDPAGERSLLFVGMTPINVNGTTAPMRRAAMNHHTRHP